MNQQFVPMIPNSITFCRILFFPIMVYLVFREERFLFSLLFFASLISDILDGLLARVLKVQSEFGAKIDSFADLLMFGAGVYGTVIFEPGFISRYRFWILLVVGLFFSQMILSLIRFSSISSFHTLASRIAAYSLGILLMTLFWFGEWAPIAYISLFLSSIAYLEEIIILFVLKELRSNVGGLYRIWKKK